MLEERSLTVLFSFRDIIGVLAIFLELAVVKSHAENVLGILTSRVGENVTGTFLLALNRLGKKRYFAS